MEIKEILHELSSKIVFRSGIYSLHRPSNDERSSSNI